MGLWSTCFFFSSQNGFILQKETFFNNLLSGCFEFMIYLQSDGLSLWSTYPILFCRNKRFVVKDRFKFMIDLLLDGLTLWSTSFFIVYILLPFSVFFVHIFFFLCCPLFLPVLFSFVVCFYLLPPLFLFSLRFAFKKLSSCNIAFWQFNKESKGKHKNRKKIKNRREAEENKRLRKKRR